MFYTVRLSIVSAQKVVFAKCLDPLPDFYCLAQNQFLATRSAGFGLRPKLSIVSQNSFLGSTNLNPDFYCLAHFGLWSGVTFGVVGDSPLTMFGLHACFTRESAISFPRIPE